MNTIPRTINTPYRNKRATTGKCRQINPGMSTNTSDLDKANLLL